MVLLLLILYWNIFNRSTPFAEFANDNNIILLLLIKGPYNFKIVVAQYEPKWSGGQIKSQILFIYTTPVNKGFPIF